MRENLVQYLYIAAGLSFVFAIKWMTAPTTARRGVLAGEIGMVLAVVGTLVRPEVTQFTWIIVGLMAGAAIGVPLAAFVPMTAMPQRTALSHAFGGIAAGLVGTAEYYLRLGEGPEWLTPFRMVALIAEILFQNRSE